MKAGRIAERGNTGKVSVENLRKGFEDVDSASLLKGLKYLSEEEKLLLRIIAENQPLNSGRVHELYAGISRSPLKERRLRDTILGLEKKSFVSGKQVSLGNKGKTKEYSSKIPKQFLLNELAKT